jgi:hypothetical protein
MGRQTEGLAGPELETLNNCGGEGCGYTKFFQFKGIIGTFAGFWAFTLLLILLYFVRRAPPPAIEFTIYSLFTGSMFFFLYTSITECFSVVLASDFRVCKEADYTNASLVFATATFALNIETMFLVWRQWREARFVGLPSSMRKHVDPMSEEDEEE